MMDQFFAQVKIDDALREAEKARLIKYESRSQKNQIRQRLAKLAYQFRLTQTC